MDYALNPINKRPETSGLRNHLVNAKNFGFGAALGSGATRYPRERLFNGLALLLWVENAVIGNGVDLEFFKPDAVDDPRADKPTVLFCGAMEYVPNVDALNWFFEEIFDDLKKEMPELEMLIVGRSPADDVKAYDSKPGVTVTGGVPDVRPYYRRSWLQLVPLRIGGGTRLKIVESMAIGTPVLSTTIGAQGLGINHDLRARLDSEGQKTANERFSWHHFGKKLCEAYESSFQK